MSRNAAVIVLFERSTQSLILTVRNTRLRQYPGEICFPGGYWEEQDKNLYATGLRELQEELGIADRVQLLKELTPEMTLQGSQIVPWLTAIDHLHPYKPNYQEVEAIVALPIQQVLLPQNYKKIMMKRQDKTIVSTQFIASQSFIWGATARIMKQLCSIEKEIWKENMI